MFGLKQPLSFGWTVEKGMMLRNNAQFAVVFARDILTDHSISMWTRVVLYFDYVSFVGLVGCLGWRNLNGFCQDAPDCTFLSCLCASSVMNFYHLS